MTLIRWRPLFETPWNSLWRFVWNSAERLGICLGALAPWIFQQALGAPPQKADDEPIGRE